MYNKVERNYKDDFFELIEKYNEYKEVSESIFNEILQDEKVYMHYILRNKELVNYYGDSIRKCLLSNSKYAELILEKYEIENLNQRKDIHFPKLFSLGDK